MRLATGWHEPSWHTVIHRDGSPVYVFAEQAITSTRTLPDGRIAYLPRFTFRVATSYSEVNQAIIDKDWTWNDRQWGGEDVSSGLPPMWWKRKWMMNWILDLYRLSVVGLNRYRFVTVDWAKE